MIKLSKRRGGGGGLVNPTLIPKNTNANNNNTDLKIGALDDFEDSTFAAQAEESNSTFDTWMN